MWQLSEPFSATELVEHVCRTLKHQEVNWKCLLGLTAVILVTRHEAGQLIQSNCVPFVFFTLCCFFHLSLEVAKLLNFFGCPEYL